MPALSLVPDVNAAMPEEFLAVASHELRMPLATIALQLEMAQSFVSQVEGAPSRVGETIQRAQQQIRRLTRLIEDIRDASSAPGGRMALRPEAMDLSAVIRDVVEGFVACSARAKSPLLCHADCVVVGNWDRLRIEQLVGNLLSNAIKFGGGAPITVRVERHDRTARIYVCDQGMGIAPAELPRIFARFARAPAAESHEGLGIGLWIAGQIVAALAGTLLIESQEGAGSTFMVELPIG